MASLGVLNGQSVLLAPGPAILPPPPIQAIEDVRVLDPSTLQFIRDELNASDAAAILEVHATARELVEHALAVDQIRVHERKLAAAHLKSVSVYGDALASQYNHMQSYHIAQSALLKDLHQVEQQDLRSQASALTKKLITNGNIAVETPEIRGGYTGPANGIYGQHGVYKYNTGQSRGLYGEEVRSESELERDNRLLKADVRFYKKRVRESDAQVGRMEAEIRQLRASLLNGAPLIALDTEIVLPPLVAPSGANAVADELDVTPPVSGPPTELEKARRKRLPLMGDAEAEHLLLAGKRLSHLRRIQRVPLSRAILSEAERIVAGKDGYEFPPPVVEMPPPAEPITREVAKAKPKKATSAGTSKTPPPSPSKGKASVPTTPARGGTKRPASASRPATPHPNPGESMSPGKTGTPFLGISELLEAAQTVLEPEAEGSTPKRRKVTLEQHIDAVKGTPETGLKKALVPTASGDKGKGKEKADQSRSALDFLADQAITSSHNPVAALAAPFGLPPLGTSLLPSPFGAPSPFGPRPAHHSPSRPSDLHFSPQASSSRPIASPVAPRPSGLIFDTPDDPRGPPTTKRPRSPYVRWAVAEDEMLCASIVNHGCKWESVAAEVPSRSYHQCRQRWLRGLKSGDALPEELAHFRPAVKKAIQEYEASRHKNKTKNFSEVGEQGTDQDREEGEG